MTLAQPIWLLCALLIPLAIALLRRKRPAGIPLSTFRLLADADKRPRRLGLVLAALRLSALALVVIALARPQGPGRWFEEKRYGIDMMLALDISGSMRAEDFQPANRLEVAKRVLKDFVAKNAEHRLGLVAFAGRSLTLCPLTTDAQAVSQLVDRIGFDSVGQDGTAIGDGIGNSLYRLAENEGKSKVIVLMSDGENNSGYLQPLDAAAMAKARGVKVYTIAVGRPGGAPIPLTDSFGRKVYVRNRDGSLFLPKMDEQVLARIAEMTGGRYFRATDSRGLEAAYAAIAQLEKSELPAQRHRVPSENYFGWVLAALFLVGVEVLLSTGVGSVLRGEKPHA
ncbi:MAG TPA: VWA domain-containing protein [Pantanalinema sp.]